MTKRPDLPKAPRLDWLRTPAGQAFASKEAVENATEEQLRDAIASLRAEVAPKPAADGASKRDKTNAQGKLDAYERLQEFADELYAWLEERVKYSSQAARFQGRLQQYIMTVALGVALEGEDVTVALAPDTEAVRQMFPGMSALSEVIDASAAELPEGAASE